MNLCEAIRSGKKYRRPKWDHFSSFTPFISYSYEDYMADDWQIDDDTPISKYNDTDTLRNKFKELEEFILFNDQFPNGNYHKNENANYDYFCEGFKVSSDKLNKAIDALESCVVWLGFDVMGHHVKELLKLLKDIKC